MNGMWFLGNCVPAKSRSVSTALATMDGPRAWGPLPQAWGPGLPASGTNFWRKSRILSAHSKIILQGHQVLVPTNKLAPEICYARLTRPI